MKHTEIKTVLENSKVEEVVKAIFSYETGITDDRHLEELTNMYFDTKHLTNFLDEEINEKACELLEINFL